jgi:hypothetical protein
MVDVLAIREDYQLQTWARTVQANRNRHHINSLEEVISILQDTCLLLAPGENSHFTLVILTNRFLTEQKLSSLASIDAGYRTQKWIWFDGMQRSQNPGLIYAY